MSDSLWGEELLLSFAAFTYLADKKDFKVQHHMDGFISFWYDKEEAKHHILQVIIGVSENDCGYVVIDSVDVLDTLFMRNKELINEIKTYCVRITENHASGVKINHCSVPPSQRKDIKTQIHNGETIKCLLAKEK
jgi:hypothetical protein